MRRDRRLWLLLVISLATHAAAADAGNGSLRLEYQYIRTGAFDSSIGEIDIGKTDAHVYMLAVDYALADRWSVFASLPWIQKKHTGALPHNALVDFQNFEPPDLRVWDTGEYHGGWQDLYFGVQYLAKDGPFTVSPFLSYGTPTNNYPFYAHSAIGRNLWHLPVGVALSYTPYFSDWFFGGDVSYIFTEKTLGVDVSHWLINLRASYYLTPSFVPKVFTSIKHGTKGLSWPGGFDLNNLDSEEFYYHDRTIKHNWINAGVGFDWVLNDDFVLSGSWFTMVKPEQVNIVDRAWTMALSWNFGGSTH